MKIDGSTPLKGPQADRKAASKPAPKGEEKPFAAIFKRAAAEKAAAASAASAKAPAPIPAGSPLSEPAAAALPDAPASPAAPAPHAFKSGQSADASSAAPSAEDHLETIKFRMKTGYYNTNKVDDALTDKLTGFFDDLA